MTRLRRLRRSPALYVCDEFASAEECEALRAGANDPALPSRLDTISRHDHTGFSFEWPIDLHPLLGTLSRRIDAIVGVSNEMGLTFRFRRYAVGEAHPPHVDCYDAGDLRLVITALLGLSTPDGGGATVFPRALPAVEVPALAGRLVVWCNYYPNGAPDPTAYHEGAAVTGGEKVTLTSFIYKPEAFCGYRPAVAAADEARPG